MRLLLEHGAAWVGVVDMQGRDAKDLALKGETIHLSCHLKVLGLCCILLKVLRSVVSTAGHADVLEELETYGTSTEREAPSCSR